MAGGNFFSELKRRNVYRVGAAYAVAAFVLIEIVSNVAPILDLPGWIGRAVILLLVVGFPAALCFAWVYELTPDGLKRTAEVEKAHSIRDQTGQRLNIITIALMVILAGLYGTDRFVLQHETAEGAARTSAGAPPNASPTEGISIAVLPFVNLSGDPTQEFFSDGMTEEITSALAKVKDLQVVGRTSAFEFKGQNKDLRAIGQALGAANILEGSVRKEGNQIRVTAQLIRADNGRHIWTDNYDRELKGVFAIQDEIAQAIAGALRIPLGLQAGETLVASRTGDTDSYQDYLRAKALVRGRAAEELTQPMELLEKVVVVDPGYAPAWALLSQTYGLAPNYSRAFNYGAVQELRRVADLMLPKAEAAGRRAIELDPRNADAYVGLALALDHRAKYLLAEDRYRQAMKIDPFNPDALHFYSLHLAALGHVKDAVAMRLQLRALEPLVPIFNANTARALLAGGRADAALAIARTLPAAVMAGGQSDLGRIYAAMGEYEKAADAIRAVPTNQYAPGTAEAAIRLLRRAPDRSAQRDPLDLKGLDFVYVYAGPPEGALESVERNADAGYYVPAGLVHVFHPAYAPVRKTQRFKNLMRVGDRVEYWRKYGWPDVCRPVGADDFVCD